MGFSHLFTTATQLPGFSISRLANVNGGGGGGQVQSGTYFVMFLHHVNNIEHNLKQNIYNSMEAISLILP